MILKGNPKSLFVLNADVCCSFPLGDMLKMFEEKDAEAVILGTKVSGDAATNYGCIVADPETKLVRHYVEKPESQISNLINCGVYLFSSSIFSIIKAAMHAKADKNAADPTIDPDEDENSVLRLEQDILGELAEQKKFFVCETRDFWRQIKTAGSAVPANALYLQQAFQSGSKDLAAPSPNILPPVYIHPTAQVDPTAKLGPNVSIGARAVIGAGVRIKESIVLEDVEIKHDACVLHSIVGWSSRIGAWARVEGSPTPIESHSTTVVKNGVKVQSVTILAKECVVHDEVRVQNCVCLPFKELKRVCLKTEDLVPTFLLSSLHVCFGMNSRLTPRRTLRTKSSCKRPDDVDRTSAISHGPMLRVSDIYIWRAASRACVPRGLCFCIVCVVLCCFFLAALFFRNTYTMPPPPPSVVIYSHGNEGTGEKSVFEVDYDMALVVTINCNEDNVWFMSCMMSF